MKKRALLIGVNQYHLLGNLSYARQDAEAVGNALCRYCGFTEQDITLMTCQSGGASLGFSRYIENALMNLTDEKDVDLLVFGFWGHGFASVSARRYLCGIDTAENDLERTAVSMDVIKAKLSQVQAENTLLFLDCCQNRPSGRSTSAEPMTQGEEATLGSMARDIQAAQRKQQTVSLPTVAILNACCEGQKAYEWDSRQHGIFTAHLLDAFQRGFESIAPLASWTVDRVAKTAREIHSQNQVPFITIEGKGDIPLSKVSASQAPREETKKPPIRPSARPPKPPQPIQPKPTAQWWVLVDSQEKGPLNESAIRDLIADRKILPESFCWAEGMSEWQTFTKTKLLSSMFPPKRSSVAASSKTKTGNTQQLYEELWETITYDIEQCVALLKTGKEWKSYIKDMHLSRLADWQHAADLGWPEGQWFLGGCCKEGFGKPKDKALGAEWYRRAAEQRYAIAQNNLGMCYYFGQGVTENHTKAVKWFRKAAEQGYEGGQCSLGVCYDHGQGVTKDQTQAVKWYHKAAEQGNVIAQSNLGKCYYYGKGVTENHTKAVKWFRKAAEQGYALAQTNLALCYDSGEGVTENQTEAVKWYRKAAEQGYAQAQNSLGYCYDNGIGVKENHTKAVKWYRKAAGQGYAQAQNNLGLCYGSGEGVTENQTEAVKWYRKAAEQGHVDAQNNLNNLEKNTPFCFITTIVCTALNKSDNCPELTSLRKFRDTYMQQTPGRRTEITEYYRIAPMIVKTINAQQNHDELWCDLAQRFILPCVNLADANNPEGTYYLYREMIMELKQKYFPLAQKEVPLV